MKTFITGITIVCVSILALAVAVPRVVETEVPKSAPSGWYCETRSGTCWFSRQDCDDESCHWRRRAFATFYTAPETVRGYGSAFETVGICEESRKDENYESTPCVKMTPAQYIERNQKKETP